MHAGLMIVLLKLAADQMSNVAHMGFLHIIHV